MYYVCTHDTEHKCRYGSHGSECTYCAPPDCPFARRGIDPLEVRLARLEQVVNEQALRIRILEVDNQRAAEYTGYRYIRPSED